MNYRFVAGWVVGLALTASIASVNCGGDDDAGTTGTAGSGGAGGNAGTSGTAGKGGGGSAGKGGTAGSSAGKGGSAGSGTAGSAGTGGTAGSAGTGGTAGAGGTGGTPEAGTDAPTDAPKSDASDASRPDTGGDASDASATDSSDAAVEGASSDAPDGAVAFAAVKSLLNTKCGTCHRPRDAGAPLFDFQTEAGLYDRLIAPLPDNEEGMCGFGDAGIDGGDAAPQSRRLVVPSDPGQSFLYLKVAGTQPSDPTCGVRMPRIRLTAEDGGPAGTTGCDQADGGAASNCLSQSDLDVILHWIAQGAPNN
jgi:hypothetical protein